MDYHAKTIPLKTLFRWHKEGILKLDPDYETATRILTIKQERTLLEMVMKEIPIVRIVLVKMSDDTYDIVVGWCELRSLFLRFKYHRSDFQYSELSPEDKSIFDHYSVTTTVITASGCNDYLIDYKGFAEKHISSWYMMR